MDELNPTVREQEIYEEMELTPEMIKSIRTLCATCLRHFVEAKNCYRAECRQQHGYLHCLSDPAWLRLCCNAPLIPVLYLSHRRR